MLRPVWKFWKRALRKFWKHAFAGTASDVPCVPEPVARDNGVGVVTRVAIWDPRF
jgi:hypothetical protein